jgi:photosystem II stability/assembly factor-like uncharacterized protein
MRWTVATAVLLLSWSANAEQWRSVGTEVGLGRWAVAVDPLSPKVIYADALNGRELWKSVDGGENWTSATTECPDPATIIVERARVGGVSVLHRRDHDYSIARSIDGGITWTRRDLSKELFGVATGSMAIDPEKPDTIFVAYSCIGLSGCTRGGGVMRSTNGGKNWSAVLSNVSTEAVTTDPVTSGVVYAKTPSGVLQSVDSGSSWQVIGPAQQTGGLFLVDSTTGMTLYLIDRASVSGSHDRGKTWLPAHPLAPDTFAYQGFTEGAIDPADRTVVFVSTGNGPYRSRDGGVTWEALRDGFEDPNNLGRFGWVTNFAWGSDARLWASSAQAGLHVLEPAGKSPLPRRKRRAVH